MFVCVCVRVRVRECGIVGLLLKGGDLKCKMHVCVCVRANARACVCVCVAMKEESMWKIIRKKVNIEGARRGI